MLNVIVHLLKKTAYKSVFAVTEKRDFARTQNHSGLFDRKIIR